MGYEHILLLAKSNLKKGSNLEAQAQEVLKSFFKKYEVDANGRVSIDDLERFCHAMMKRYKILVSNPWYVNDGMMNWSYSNSLSCGAAASDKFLCSIQSKTTYELWEKNAMLVYYYIKTGEAKPRERPYR